jgi:hypothetical protein
MRPLLVSLKNCILYLDSSSELETRNSALVKIYEVIRLAELLLKHLEAFIVSLFTLIYSNTVCISYGSPFPTNGI